MKKLLKFALGIGLISFFIGCTTSRDVVTKRIYFAENIDYEESRYYINPSDSISDDGKLKKMLVGKPTPNVLPLGQEKYAEDYHKQHPECSMGYYR